MAMEKKEEKDFGKFNLETSLNRGKLECLARNKFGNSISETFFKGAIQSNLEKRKAIHNFLLETFCKNGHLEPLGKKERKEFCSFRLETLFKSGYLEQQRKKGIQ